MPSVCLLRRLEKLHNVPTKQRRVGGGSLLTHHIYLLYVVSVLVDDVEVEWKSVLGESVEHGLHGLAGTPEKNGGEKMFSLFRFIIISAGLSLCQ